MSKNTFGSKLGFIMATAGSAVGLGNICSFPYKTACNGGAAFVLVYVLMVLLLGIVAMTAEMAIGKRAHANPLTSYKKADPRAGFIGVIAIAIPFIITCYYSLLGGYTVFSAYNSIASIGSNFTEVTDSMESFKTNGFLPVLCTVIFLVLTLLVIIGGVKDGIERYSKVLMPALITILIAIVVYSLTLGEGVREGLEFYILKIDFTKLGWSGVIRAMGQAFYSLSIGMGILISYGSYTGKEVNLGKSAIQVAIIDTVIALLAGLAIFPSAYHFSMVNNVSLDTLGMNGIRLMFATLPQVFASMGVIGGIIGCFFFIMVGIAALTSVVSLLEVLTQSLIQNHRMSRKKAAIIPCILITVLSIPVSISFGGAFDFLGYDLYTFLDELTNTVTMPLCALGSCIVAGYLIPKDDLIQTVNFRSRLFPEIFRFMLRYITPVLILVVEIFGIISGVKDSSSYWSIVLISYGLIIVLALSYFLFFRNFNSGTNEDEK